MQFIFFSSFIASWAVSTVMTRQNAIPMERNNNNETSKSDGETSAMEITQMPALIPFWDLANHKNGVITTSYNVTDEQIEGATLSDVRKGEQIFIYYGDRNNANMLVHNGFVDSKFIKFNKPLEIRDLGL